MYVNAVVVVGDRFDPAMFKPAEQFFGGAVDPGQMLVGPIAQFGYRGGQCAFALNPGRIDLTMRSEHEVMPEELLAAGRELINTLMKIRSAVTITGLGLNCDTVFRAPPTGVEIVDRLVRADAIRKVTGERTSQVATTTIRYVRGPLTYSLRIEPEVQSAGRNLFIAVNGHQDIAPEHRLGTKLRHFPEFRKHVKDLHARIPNTLY